MTRYAFGAVIGALVLWIVMPAPRSEYVDPIVVTKRVIERGEPDTIVRWRERVVTVIERPIVQEISPGAAQPDVATFCADAVARALEGEGDGPDPPPPRTLLLRSVSTDPGHFMRPDRVTMVAPLSTGDLARMEYSVRPGWSARTSGDSVIVRSPRFGLLKEVGEASVYVGLGWLLHSVMQ